MIQVSGDLEDLKSALGKHRSRQRMVGSGHCSALIKVLPNQKDVFVGQNMWNSFASMLRVLKKYDFQYHLTAGKNSITGDF